MYVFAGNLRKSGVGMWQWLECVRRQHRLRELLRRRRLHRELEPLPAPGLRRQAMWFSRRNRRHLRRTAVCAQQLPVNTASGFSLPKGSSVTSCGGAATLAHQGDGNVVVYQNSSGSPVWSTITAGYNTANLAMQGDGNLVLYGPSSEVYWYSNTAGYSGAYAAIQDDCNFVIYQGGTAVWADYMTCQ